MRVQLSNVVADSVDRELRREARELLDRILKMPADSIRSADLLFLDNTSRRMESATYTPTRKMVFWLRYIAERIDA
jgi:hypothetical protein